MTTLESLVTRIDAKAYSPGNRNHFIFNSGTGEFESKVPFFAGRLQYYSVVLSTTGAPTATGRIGPVGVVDAVSGALVRLFIVYEAWIQPGHAEHVIRVAAGDNPGAQLVHLLVSAVQQRVARDPAALTDRSPARISAIARTLQDDIAEQNGLSCRLTLELERQGDASDTALSAVKVEVPIRLGDYATDLKLPVILEVSIDGPDQVYAAKEAMRRRPPAEAVREICQAFFLRIGLHEFRQNLNGRLLEGLRARLDDDLRAWHLQLETLAFGPVGGLPRLPPNREVVAAFEIEVRGYPRKVRMRTRLQLELRDEARYHLAGWIDLQAWADATVKPAVQRVLFTATYSQLYLQFAQWEQQILHALEAAAAGIGYAVKVHVTEPDMPEVRFLSPFPLEVSGEFSTAVDFISSRLSIAMQLQVTDFIRIAPSVDRGVDLEKAFRDAVTAEVTAYLHTIQPAFLFTRFIRTQDFTGATQRERDRRLDNRQPVSEALRERIVAILKKDFGITTISFTPKLGSSAIRETFLSLLALDRIDFQVDLPVYGQPTRVTHHGALAVTGVDRESWLLFQNLRPTPEKVAQAAASTVQSMVAENTALIKRALFDEELRALVYQQLSARILAWLGVRASVKAWFPNPSLGDAIAAEAMEANARQQSLFEVTSMQDIRQQILKLRRDAQDLHDAGREEEAKKKEERAADLETKLWAQSAAGGAARLAAQGGAPTRGLPRSSANGTSVPDALPAEPDES